MKTRKRRPSHPGGILKRHYLVPLSLSVSMCAQLLGISRKTLSKIVNEKGAVSPEMALRLSKAFETTPEMWLNLQKAYELWETAHNTTEWKLIKPVSKFLKSNKPFNQTSSLTLGAG